MHMQHAASEMNSSLASQMLTADGRGVPWLRVGGIKVAMSLQAKCSLPEQHRALAREACSSMSHYHDPSRVVSVVQTTPARLSGRVRQKDGNNQGSTGPVDQMAFLPASGLMYPGLVRKPDDFEVSRYMV